MRPLMAVDYGEARTGAAFSDPTRTIAGAALTIKTRGVAHAAEELAKLAAERNAGAVAVGLPRNMDGSTHERAVQSERLKAELEARLPGVPVVLLDERLTTVLAHRLLTDAGKRGQKKVADAAAAVVILEDFLRTYKD